MKPAALTLGAICALFLTVAPLQADEAAVFGDEGWVSVAGRPMGFGAFAMADEQFEAGAPIVVIGYLSDVDREDAAWGLWLHPGRFDGEDVLDSRPGIRAYLPPPVTVATSLAIEAADENRALLVVQGTLVADTASTCSTWLSLQVEAVSLLATP